MAVPEEVVEKTKQEMAAGQDTPPEKKPEWFYFLLQRIDNVERTLRQEIKQEIGGLRQEIGGVRQEVEQRANSLRQEMKQEIGAVRQDIGGVRQEVEQRTDSLRQEMKQEIGGVRQDIGGIRREVEQRTDSLRQEIASVRLWAVATFVSVLLGAAAIIFGMYSG